MRRRGRWSLLPADCAPPLPTLACFEGWLCFGGGWPHDARRPAQMLVGSWGQAHSSRAEQQSQRQPVAGSRSRRRQQAAIDRLGQPDSGPPPPSDLSPPKLFTHTHREPFLPTPSQQQQPCVRSCTCRAASAATRSAPSSGRSVPPCASASACACLCLPPSLPPHHHPPPSLPHPPGHLRRARRGPHGLVPRGLGPAARAHQCLLQRGHGRCVPACLPAFVHPFIQSSSATRID